MKARRTVACGYESNAASGGTHVVAMAAGRARTVDEASDVGRSAVGRRTHDAGLSVSMKK
jgi:hypothetical protein